MLGALGLGLACFAALAAHAAANVFARRSIIALIIGADMLWVASSPIAVLTGANALTAAGQGLIAVVGVIVAALATAQWTGLRRYSESE